MISAILLQNYFHSDLEKKGFNFDVKLLTSNIEHKNAFILKCANIHLKSQKEVTLNRFIRPYISVIMLQKKLRIGAWVQYKRY